MSDDMHHIRVEYRDSSFGPDDAGTDPMACFDRWFEEARTAGAREPNAMALGTVAPDGSPSVRTVLLKDVDAGDAAFTWFTNLDSRKSRELRAAGRAALCWWWPGGGAAPDRQVRAVGAVREVPRRVSAAYFDTRPRAAQVGAAASPQSRAVASRDVLELAAEGFGDAAVVEVPERWGGWQLVADELELWQGRGGRLHDRVTFLRLGPGDVPASAAGVDAAGGLDALVAAGDVVVDPHGARWLRARLAP